MIYISPSLLSSDFSCLGQELKSLEENGADWVHIDVMDGQFVNNITLGAPIIKSMRAHTHLPFDVHLMIQDPLRYLDDFIAAGADILTFHLEASEDNAGIMIEKIAAAGVKPSVSVKPSTPVETVFPLLGRLSMVLIMTVEPGFGGQPFLESALPKISALRQECVRRGLPLDIQVDGGINSEKIAVAAAAGANAFAVGSAVFGAKDRKATIAALRETAEEAYRA
ncbi:MAG: ribulose-phosphate 3-epimerase [Oscillospiraceae bacterium]|jgi:ribulose-phosphate 3-epimerase|nr:ribulose-phosphate 3-epimerase [Oscillospiraceae bacterium]